MMTTITIDDRYERLKIRHQLELEGYGNEVKGLKQQLRHIDHVIRHRERFNSRLQRDYNQDFTLEDVNNDDVDEDEDEETNNNNHHHHSHNHSNHSNINNNNSQKKMK